MHGPFVQLSSGNGLSVYPVVFAVAPASGESVGSDSSTRSLTAQCHAPPIFDSPPSSILRI